MTGLLHFSINVCQRRVLDLGIRNVEDNRHPEKSRRNRRIHHRCKNNRIAIFEAFRLFSLNTNVISDHLDKISGYDNESLSPIFIVAYCDVEDFAELVKSYTKFIASKNYDGFQFDLATCTTIETLDQHKTDHLWLGIEQRRRNDREVIFYHLFLNMSDC